MERHSEEWPTPQPFFDALHKEFNFSLHPCASTANAKAAIYFTKEQNGLAQDWGTHTVFCNPPYGKFMREWARKCYEASLKGATVLIRP